jgi:hypothetical protein
MPKNLVRGSVVVFLWVVAYMETRLVLRLVLTLANQKPVQTPPGQFLQTHQYPSS